MQETWFTPSILISLASIFLACGGAFAVVRYQINEQKNQMAALQMALVDLRREMVSRAEYEAQIQALNNQIAQVVTSINRMTDRFERFLDAQR